MSDTKDVQVKHPNQQYVSIFSKKERDIPSKDVSPHTPGLPQHKAGMCHQPNQYEQSQWT